MKLQLKKINNIMVPAEAASKKLLAAVNDDVYVCDLKNPKKPPEELRRLAQNSLYWDCMTALEKSVSNELAGRTKEEWHQEMKKTYLCQIFIETDPVYAALFSAMELVLQQAGRVTYDAIYRGVLEMTSTTQATVRQFSLYLSRVIHFCRVNGVALKIDRDLWDLADMEREADGR